MSNNFVWGDYISEEAVDLVVKFYNTQKFLPYYEGEVENFGENKVDKSIKESLDLSVYGNVMEKYMESYVRELQRVLELYLEKFKYACMSEFTIKEALCIQKYPIGGGYKTWHQERGSDKSPMVYRHLVFMTYLNDVPDGGTEWFHQDLYIPAKKGYTIIWPSDWTHLHRGRVSHTKEKMIITGWYSYGKD